MNKTDISREKIIEVSANILKNNAGSDLNMRNVAKFCGVSVGSLYNYFPTKSELLIAVVQNVWSQVFYNGLYDLDKDKGFTESISQIYYRIYTDQKSYHNFFLMHQTMINEAGRTQGKKAMAEYFSYVKENLLYLLDQDKRINSKIWTEELSKEKLIEFIFNNIISLLAGGKSNCDFLILILDKICYEEGR